MQRRWSSQEIPLGGKGTDDGTGNKTDLDSVDSRVFWEHNFVFVALFTLNFQIIMHDGKQI